MRAPAIALAALFLACLGAAAAAQEDGKAFRLKVGDSEVEIDAGDTVDIVLPDGSKAKATLTRNEFATYAADACSFMHPGEVSVSRSDLGDGVVQYLMATAIGSLVIIQTYRNIDPTHLKELMLKELTEDDVAAGAKVESRPVTRQVDGKALEGLSAAETLNDDETTYEIFGYSKGSGGVLIITGVDRENLAEDGPKIAKFWETLKLK